MRFIPICFSRPIRAAVKAPIVDLTESSAEDECISSSEFEPDSEHASEDDADIDDFSRLGAGDVDVSGTPSITGYGSVF